MTQLGSVERVAATTASPWWGEHVSRYAFAAKLASGRDILDIACGSGIGLRQLQEAGAKSVTGCDMAPEALIEARLAAPHATIVRADGTRLPFCDASFDLITSFETIEHIPDWDAFLRELRRVLVPGGTLVLSTPNRLVTSAYRPNPFHVREFTPDELDQNLRRHFTRVELWGQVTTPRYQISPFLPGHDHALGLRQTGELLVWKLGRRLPSRVGNQLLEMLFGRSLYPGLEDFVFDRDRVSAAHVTVASCQ